VSLITSCDIAKKGIKRKNSVLIVYLFSKINNLCFKLFNLALVVLAYLLLKLQLKRYNLFANFRALIGTCSVWNYILHILCNKANRFISRYNFYFLYSIKFNEDLKALFHLIQKHFE
jgi:hypothetical protein